MGIGGHDVGVFGRNKESGLDFNIEARFTPFEGWLWNLIYSPEPHVGFHLNTEGNTAQVFAGGSWIYDFGSGLFGGGSLGFSLHNGETETSLLNRKELGLSLLFRESLELGYQISGSHGISIRLDHISNAGIAENNEGLDTLGLKYTYGL